MRSLAVVALCAATAAAGPQRFPEAARAPASWRALAVDAPGAVADAAAAERAARAYLAAHVADLAPGATAADFRVIANTIAAGKRAVGFQQTWRGLPVVGAEVGFVFANDRLFAL